jgi:hypothetical protein
MSVRTRRFEPGNRETGRRLTIPPMKGMLRSIRTIYEVKERVS